MRTPQRQRRIGHAVVLFVALFLVVGARLAHVAIIRGPEFRKLAARQHRQVVSFPPERGEIRDRNGEALATSVESAEIFIRRPAALPLREPLIPVFASILNAPARNVAQKVMSRDSFVFLTRDATREQVAQIKSLGLPGVGVDSTRRRIYPHGSLAGRIVGFSGIDQQGLGGIEQSYDRYLRGERVSVAVHVDGRGRHRDNGMLVPEATRGAHVELTIDADLQRFAEQELEAAVAAQDAVGGIILMMDPRSGEILTMATAPQFDPASGRSSSKEQWANMGVELSYEPGSTFKGILAAAAIEADVVRPEDRIFCQNGRYQVGRRTIHDHDPYGWLSFSDVIKYSSNIGSAKVGESMGSERFFAAIRGFGFGSRTGIELPGEATGLVRPLSRWGRIHLVTTSFGQGIAVSPLQLVRAYGAIANGGSLMRPHIVRRIIAPDGAVLVEHRPEVVGQPISATTATIVTEMLRGVVDGGTATKARVAGISVAGKTGTAQKVDATTGRYHPRDRISSFIGFFPTEAPRFVMLVLLDTPRRGSSYGGVVAAPVFQRIADYAVDKAGLRIAPPSVVEPLPRALQARLASWAPSDTSRGMPSFLGLSLREALVQAARAGWDVEVDGSGYVAVQDPPAGADSIQGRKLRLTLSAKNG